jgi:DNA polymerase theta
MLQIEQVIFVIIKSIIIDNRLNKINKIIRNNQKIQIIGMSATLPNLKILSEWLKATLYQTNFRPIELNERLKFESSIFDKQMNLISKIETDSRIENDNDLLSHLVLETVKTRNGVLVFCPTKSRCEVIAENIARTIYSLDRNHGETPTYLNKDKLIDCLNELKATPAGLDNQLAKTIRFGIGFHHAGLTVEEREIVENYFKNGYLLVIVCTSTLSSGVNFPAHRVIIRTPIFNGNKPIDIITYKQMVGRAARNTNGDSILMCNNQNEKKIGIEILNAEIVQIPQNSNKQLNQDDLIPSIKRSLLEVIVSGIASKREDIINYFDCKLMTYNNDDSKVVNFEKYLEWLNKNQFIDVLKNENSQECYKPTQLGYAVVASAMAPEEGLIIFNELQKALQCFVLENELHIIYQITPINICDYWVNSSCNIDWNLYYSLYQTFKPDVKRVSDLVGVRQSFILKMMKSNTNCDQKLLKIHLRFYTALILNDLVSEVPFSTILNKYACQKGEYYVI